ncbi:MAG: lysylphosphatidylglycerol synthase transmembrane domain-containing protein [Ardenticatenaceae bacterium]
MRFLLRFLPWLAALGLLVWVLSSVSWADAWAALRQLGPVEILAFAVANSVVLLSLNGRWWLILYALGHHIPYFSLMGYRLGAFGLSYFTPGPLFGGEPLQVYLVERHHAVPRSSAIAAMSLDKTFELLINFTFLAAGVVLILQAQLFDGYVNTQAALFPLLLLAFPLGFLLATWAGWHPISRLLMIIGGLSFWQKRPTWLERYQRACETMKRSETQITTLYRAAPLLLTLALLISIISWLLMIGEYWLMWSFLGIDLTFIELIALLTAARIAILLLLPGGLGTLEASQVFALSALGINPAAGVSASVLIRTRDVMLATFGLWWASKKLR